MTLNLSQKKLLLSVTRKQCLSRFTAAPSTQTNGTLVISPIQLIIQLPFVYVSIEEEGSEVLQEQEDRKKMNEMLPLQHGTAFANMITKSVGLSSLFLQETGPVKKQSNNHENNMLVPQRTDT